jgi:hypothetical protein
LNNQEKIAVVGAGFSGEVIARELAEFSFNVRVLMVDLIWPEIVILNVMYLQAS